MSSPDPTLEQRRRISRLMAFRVAWITVVLAAVVGVHALRAEATDFDQPFLRFLFSVVLGTYALSIAYAIWLPAAKNLTRFANVQMLVDLVTASALLHVTGGAASGFVIVYLLTIVGSAMICERVGEVLATAIAGAALYVGVSTLGRTGVLPTVAGGPSPVIDGADFFRALVINLAALVGVTILAANLVITARRVGQRVAEARAYAEDTAALTQDILRSLTTGLITIDREQRVLACNEGASRLFAVPAVGTIGRPIEGVAPELLSALRTSEDQGGQFQGELGVLRRDGQQLAIGVVVAPLYDGKGVQRGSILHLEDKTALRRVEAEVTKNEELATLGRFAAGVAHEFRNPLAAVSGSIELLRGSTAATEEDRRLMDIVVREVERLDRLVATLLDYTRPREPSSMSVDLPALVSEVAQMQEGELLASGRGGVEVVLSLEPCAVKGDPDQLRQVLWNLLRNASEAVPDDGHIRVSVSAAGQDVFLEVADDGKGISPVHAPRIFEPFFSTKPRGTGLGLATVQQVVRAHGGAIELVPGGAGAHFRVTLSRATDRVSDQRK